MTKEILTWTNLSLWDVDGQDNPFSEAFTPEEKSKAIVVCVSHRKWEEADHLEFEVYTWCKNKEEAILRGEFKELKDAQIFANALAVQGA